ncbi:MAG: glycosyltransferase family 2 protein [Acidobacteriota bacterium]
MQPLVSIIIPCRNEASSIRACLESVLASNYTPERMEVLVADGMSGDGTRSILGSMAARDARLRIVDNPRRTTPHALNRAIAAARGDYILRVDAHSSIEPGYIVTLVNFLEGNPIAWGAGGRMMTEPESKGPFARPIAMVLAHPFGVGNSGFRTGGEGTQAYEVDTVFNCCWRREVFSRVGLFNQHLVRSQDIEMSTRIGRAGGTLWLVPQARTTYFARTRFWSYVRHNWINGVWSVLPAVYVRGMSVRPRHLVPLGFVLYLAASLIAAQRWGWLPLLPTVSYLIVNFLVSAAAAWRHRDARLVFLLPITFTALHLSYGAGSFCGALAALPFFQRLRPTYDTCTEP